MSEGTRHLPSETLQAYLENALDAARRSEVEAHLGKCRRCAAELEGWTLLFRELDELPALGPSVEFRERVLAQVSAPAPSEAPGAETPGADSAPGLWDRFRALIPGARRAASEHLSPERIQDLLDGALGGRKRRAVAMHLAACRDCGAELEAWRGVFSSLEALPELAPSSGFAERVMAAVDTTPAPASVPVWKRVPQEAVGLARRLLPAPRRLVPSTRKGWALAGGVVAVPMAVTLALLGAVVAHPLVTVGDLAAFVSWRAEEVAGLAGSWLLARVIDSPVLTWGWSLVELLASSPGVAVGGLLALWSLMLLAAWVLYRNVIHPFLPMERHVR